MGYKYCSKQRSFIVENLYLRGEIQQKPQSTNNLKTVIVRPKYIFYDFSTYPPLIRIHFSQRSNHLVKALAKSSLLRVLRTPSHLFLNSSWVMVMPASSFFNLGKRKKSAGARSGE